MKYRMEDYMVLVANCIPVKGYSRSVIYDLYRETFDFIPNDLYDILKKYNKQELGLIFGNTPVKFHHILNDYFDFLLDNEYVLLTNKQDELECFPDLDLGWDMPSIITNAIIDIKQQQVSIEDYTRFLVDLNDLGCTYLQIRLFKGYHHKTALQLFDYLNGLNMVCEVIMPYDASFSPQYYINLYKEYQKLCSISVFDYHGKLDFFEEEAYRPFAQYIHFTPEVVTDQSHCGVISPGYFSVNIPTFTESLKYNSCLNRKVSVDQFGNIKNCPSLTTSFGRIGSHPLKKIVETEEFKACWTLNKDKIKTCQVCEFRYMCTDCRAFVADETDKPFKCGYNPETCEWT